MLGFWYKNGEKVTVDVLRKQEFVTGKAKMQYASRGVVELADGTVRTFGVLHKPDDHGHHHVVGKPMRLSKFNPNIRDDVQGFQSYEDVMNGLREFEAEWIIEELPAYVRNKEINPVTVTEEVEGKTW